ncbi:hypothetical protein [Streptomyces sp. x-80]|uniref:hypothetical protein n=1 Tax=Streptomyces sp. x-80 TaxID=2789282 RepID=UPI00397FFEEF
MLSEHPGLRQESRELRVTVVSPGFTSTELTHHGGSEEAQAAARAATEVFAIPASAIAQAIGYAIGQPTDVDVNELVVRPTAQGRPRAPQAQDSFGAGASTRQVSQADRTTTVLPQRRTGLPGPLRNVAFTGKGRRLGLHRGDCRVPRSRFRMCSVARGRESPVPHPGTRTYMPL